MGAKQTKIDLVIGAVDKFTAPLRKLNDKMEGINRRFSGLPRAYGNLSSEGSRFARFSGFDEVTQKAANFGQKIGDVAGALGRLAAQGTAVALGLGFAFKTQFVDVASEFERFETVLTTLNQGDAGKAKNQMDWISAFAAKTPYQLAEVTDSFVKLRSYGLDPTKGLLLTLGDTASAMGKPLDQAVEAIADAVNGESERLKEFGITAEKVGNKIVYSYTNAAGKQAKIMANANDRAAIQATLTEVWAEKFSGGMAAQSKTFSGMISNISDAWSQFANLVMSNGVFDWMKGKLSGVLAKIEEMNQNGKLQAWAKDIGEKLTTFFDKAWSVLPKLWDGVQKFGDKLAWLADVLGGWENLGLVLATSMSGLLGPLAAMTGAFLQLGIAMMANPFGLVVAGIAAVGAGLFALWKYWDEVTGWIRKNMPFGDVIADGMELVARGLNAIWENWQTIVGWIEATLPFNPAYLALEGLIDGIKLIGKYWEKLVGVVSLANPFNGIFAGIEFIQNGFASLGMKGAGGDTGAGTKVGSFAGFDGGSLVQFSQQHAAAMEQRPSTNAAAIARQSAMQTMHSSHTERQESTVKIEVMAPQGTRIHQEGAPVDMDTVYLGQAAFG